MFLRSSQLRLEHIGGAEVRRAFRMGTHFMRTGMKMSPEDVMSIRPANRQSLIDKGFLWVWPRSEEAPVSHGKRYAIHVGGGSYDVIEGRKLNDEPLSREDAQALAASSNH